MKFEKGKPKALTSEQKIVIGLKTAVFGTSASEVCWPTDINISEVTSTPMGTPDKPCERIKGKGTLTLNRRDAKSSDILMPKTNMVFSITVEDSKDEWGLPDVKVSGFSLK